MKKLHYFLVDEHATTQLGNVLAAVISQQSKGMIVYLQGELGAGKTTLTRGFVQGLGHQGKVKSPTYTLVEPYELSPWFVYHFDLYRLADPEELEFMGIRDYFADNCCCFIEWPEKGAGLLPNADIMLNIAYSEEQRQVTLAANSAWGEIILTLFEKLYLGS